MEVPQDTTTTGDCEVTEAPPRKKAKQITENYANLRDFSTLPVEVLLIIFKYMDLKSICNSALVCSKFNNISQSESIYRKVSLKYNMSPSFLKAYINKLSRPTDVYIDYKFSYTTDCETEDYTQFNKYVELFLQKCGEHIISLKVESCRSDETLLNLSKCVNVQNLTLFRCESSFKTLPSITTLISIRFVSCHFPQKVVTELFKNNANLKTILLWDNVNVNVIEICENMPKYNAKLETIELGEKKKIKTRSIRSMAKLPDLRKLELMTGRTGFQCDPEDSFKQLAAGCSKLEKLAIYGWKELIDDNFIPALPMFTQLKELDLRGTNITIKTGREAAKTLPRLKSLDLIKCWKVKKAELKQLKKEFPRIYISLDS